MRTAASIAFVLSLCAAIPLAAQEQQTPFDKRMADPTVKGLTQQVASTLIASGRDSTREQSRNLLGEWWWAFYDDAGLSGEEREAAEIAFDEAFEALAKTMRERKVAALMIAGIDDVATPMCMRWHFLTVGPRGPLLVSIVFYNADGKPRLRDLHLEDDWTTVERTLNEVDLAAGEKALTIHLPFPPAPAASQPKEAASTPEAPKS